MQIIARTAFALAIVVGGESLLGQAAAPPASATSAPHRYSAQQFGVGGMPVGFFVTDHVENKLYVYVLEGKAAMELESVIDLNKTGQPRIEFSPTTRPAATP